MGEGMTDKRPVCLTPVCLTIGGSDACGGAGIQADLRVFEQFGIKGCSVITALTAQNPQEILRIEPVSLAQVDAELTAIFDYYDVAAVKTGMLVDAEHIAVISALLDEYHTGKPLVVDPVMVASSGQCLLDEGAVQTLGKTLIRQATLVTPNLDEAYVLLGRSTGDAVEDAKALASNLGCAVLLKGGHGEGDVLMDVLCEGNSEITSFEHQKQDWDSDISHGTGCRLAAAITASLGLGHHLAQSVDTAVKQLQKTI